MITVQDIVTLLEGLAPPALAESWDNVGLLCGDRAREVTNVLCSLDITEQVVAEAAERCLLYTSTSCRTKLRPKSKT